MDRRVLLGAVGVALLVGVPFLGKAFHIDDGFVLEVSAQILREPLRPFHGQINWRSDPLPIAEATKNPPLVSYFLAPLIAFFGYSEVALHAGMIVFLVLLAVGAALLGRWFWVGEWWPMLFVMLGPAVVVQGNVMRDVPAAALVTLGLALFVLGTDEDRRWQLAVGSLLVGLATLAKYSSAALVPLLVLYPVLHRKWRYALWALVPVAVLGLWCLQNWLSLGDVHILMLLRQRAAKEHGFGRPWQEKSYAGLTIIGSTLFLLPVVLVAWLRRRVWLALPLVVAAAVAGVYGANAWLGKPTLAERPDRVALTDGRTYVGSLAAETPDKVAIAVRGREQPVVVPRTSVAEVTKLTWQYTLWIATGAALVFVMLGGGLGGAARGLRARDGSSADWLFLLAWLGLSLGFSVVVVPFQATRHFLPAMAPMAVLVLRLLGPLRKPVKIALGAMLVVQAAVAFLVGFGDAEHAGAYREFARHGARKYRNAGHDVWFNGHWGWQHYALAAGFKQLSFSGDPPKPGAIVLDPRWVHHVRYPKGLKKELIEEVEYPAMLPIRTMDMRQACFYMVSGHLLPYHFTRESTPVQIGRVYRVTAAPASAHEP